jgi:hypothetical protein
MPARAGNPLSCKRNQPVLFTATVQIEQQGG